MPDLLYQDIAAAFGGPFSKVATLLDAALVGTEGLWVPTAGLKTMNILFTGSMDTMSATILGTNQVSEPLNQNTITIGGSATATDVATLTVTNANIPGGSVSVSYTVQVSDTLTIIAAALAALLNSADKVRGCGATFSSSGAVITASFPSVYPAGNTETPSYGNTLANVTTFSGSSNGTETVTVAAITTLGTAIGSAITALGFVVPTLIPRWLRVRLPTLTGTSANITAMLAGAG